jgi:protein MpaA
MQKLKLFLTLSMALSLAACAIIKNDPSVDDSIDVKVPPDTKGSTELKVATDFGPPSKPPVELAVEDQKSDKLEESSEPRLRTSNGKDTIVLKVESKAQLKEFVQASASDSGAEGAVTPSILMIESDPTAQLCQEIGNKLGSVNVEDCLNQNLIHSAYTAAKRSLAFKDYLPKQGRESLGRVLVIGGIHGDEYSSVSVIIKWMKILDENHSGLFHWRFVPTANPDGLLKVKSQRQNSNGVDLNRNFPTADWVKHATLHWKQKTYQNPRRYPGPHQASELETQWLIKQIKEFEPDAIVALHAPYHLVDYDGPPTAPEALGGLSLRRLGVYPGSLGNYAGVDLMMPIVTVELKSAGIMPRKKEVDRMWRDLVQWLRSQLSSPPEIDQAHTLIPN